MMVGGSQAQPRVQLIGQACGDETGPRSSWETNSLVRVRMRIRSGGRNQGQTQLLMTGPVQSAEAGPRSSQEVSLQLRVPTSGAYG